MNLPAEPECCPRPNVAFIMHIQRPAFNRIFLNVRTPGKTLHPGTRMKIHINPATEVSTNRRRQLIASRDWKTARPDIWTSSMHAASASVNRAPTVRSGD